MNEFDELMGLDPVAADSELNGFFSKVFKKVKKAVKKVTKPVVKVGKQVLKSHVGKIALGAATGFAGTALIGALGGSSTIVGGLVSKASGYVSAARSALKRNFPLPYKAASSLNRARLAQRRANAARVRAARQRSSSSYRQPVRRSSGYNRRQAARRTSYSRSRNRDALAKKRRLIARLKQRSSRRKPYAERRRSSKARLQHQRLAQQAARNANTVLNAGENAARRALPIAERRRIAQAANALRAQGKTPAQIRDLYLTSRTFRNSALPATTEVTRDAIYKDLILRGVPEDQAAAFADAEAAKVAADAVGQVQNQAAGGNLGKLLPFALPAAAFLLSS